MIPNFWGRFFGNALEVNADGGEEVPVWESEALSNEVTRDRNVTSKVTKNRIPNQ